MTAHPHGELEEGRQVLIWKDISNIFDKKRLESTMYNIILFLKKNLYTKTLGKTLICHTGQEERE